MRPEFVDREAELEFLERRYREERPHLLVIYGRRRVGKTELLKRFLAGKPCVSSWLRGLPLGTTWRR